MCHGGEKAVAAVAAAAGGERVGVAESDAFRVVGPRRSWEVGSCSCHLLLSDEKKKEKGISNVKRMAEGRMRTW